MPAEERVPASPVEPAPMVPTRPPSDGRLLWWLTILIVVTDQITKLLVERFIPLFDSVTIVPGLLDLIHIHNAGVAFGFLNDFDPRFRVMLTTGLALVALAGIVYYSRQVPPNERLAQTGLSLILGGAIGNLIDRMRLGHVVDFIDVYQGTWHFWAFNVADAAISCGAALIFIELFFTGRHASHTV
jgi:signal peptidase II